MKTLTRSTALLFAALLISVNIFATGLEFEPEQYIDDIPFNTEKIAKQVIYQNALAVEFSFSDEEYINDIPFSDNYLTKLKMYYEAVSQQFSLSDEEYIDDIPSNIALVSSVALMSK